MQKEQILIAGAGAAGLMAARELCREGHDVTILEGRNRTGGRILTQKDAAYNATLELGAEFIHGKLPLTLQLLKEYELEKIKTAGRFYNIVNGEFQQNDEIVIDYHGELAERLRKTESDISVTEFLNSNFPEPRYSLLRESVTKFVEGYDTADCSRSSVLALKEEWLNDEEVQYRVLNGYGALVHALETDCIKSGCKLHLNTIVKTISWKPGIVQVNTSTGNTYSASKIILTFPLGIWTASTGASAFKLIPEIPEIRQAASAMGYGSLIKILLVFNTAFWEKESVQQWTGVDTTKMGFVFSKAEIPTWWTQSPEKYPILCGWLGGPPALKFANATEQEIIEAALGSLENIFGERPAIYEAYIANWNEDPFSLGSYSYRVVNADKHLRILTAPVQDTIYLAGEALNNKEGIATVEAALQSGKETAEKIIASVLAE